MSNPLADAGLPPSPPSPAVIDYSGTLSSNAQDLLGAQAKQVHMKIVILQKNFHSDDFPQFARALGHQWRVSGDRILMVVDLKDHKVRMEVGNSAQARGLTPDYVSHNIIADQFVPSMKQGDLQGAIQHSIDAVQQKLAVSHTVAGTAEPSYQYSQPAPSAGAHEGSSAVIFFVLVLGLIVVFSAVSYFFNKREKRATNELLAKQFEAQAAPLYEYADQIGQSSEFLNTTKNADLAKRVADFFNRLATFQQAQSEVERLSKDGKDVREGYTRLLRMIGLLQPEAKQLKSELFAITGGVDTVGTAAPSLDEQLKKQDDELASQTIKVPEKVEQQMAYRRPQWTYEPAYYQPAPSSGLDSLMMLGMWINQMEMGHRMDQMSWELAHQQNYNNNVGGFSDAGGGWGWGNSSSDNSGGGWGDSGGGGGWGDSGGGGGWGDSGGGFSDSGGDWGGGGDSGGDSGGGW